MLEPDETPLEEGVPATYARALLAPLPSGTRYADFIYEEKGGIYQPVSRSEQYLPRRHVSTEMLRQLPRMFL